MKPTLLFFVALIIAPLTAMTEPIPKKSQIRCQGSYQGHLQGVVADDEAIYWSFTQELVKTDLDGRLILKIPVANHHGDLCLKDNKLYVAVNLGKFNDANGNADSWVYVYDKTDLTELARHAVPQAEYGAGGIEARAGNFYIVGGLPTGIEENYVYEYDENFQFLRRHTLDSGYTRLGIQTAFFHNGRWYFGCYGKPQPILLIADQNLKFIGRHAFNAAVGIEDAGEGLFYIGATWRQQSGKYTGLLRFARLDEEKGMELLPNP